MLTIKVYNSRLLIKSESSISCSHDNIIWLGQIVIHTSVGRNPYLTSTYITGWYRGCPRILPAYVRIRTKIISTEEGYCLSSLVSVERPLRRDRSTIRPLALLAERILRDLSILFLSSAIRVSLNNDITNNTLQAFFGNQLN